MIHGSGDVSFLRGTFFLENTGFWEYDFTKVGRHMELWVYILKEERIRIHLHELETMERI